MTHRSRNFLRPYARYRVSKKLRQIYIAAACTCHGADYAGRATRKNLVRESVGLRSRVDPKLLKMTRGKLFLLVATLGVAKTYVSTCAVYVPCTAPKEGCETSVVISVHVDSMALFIQIKATLACQPRHSHLAWATPTSSPSPLSR